MLSVHTETQHLTKIARAANLPGKRPGVDVGDPDGLWRAEFADRVLKSVEDHRAGKNKSVPYAEVRKNLGLAD
ncbi:MAG: hypothetical protein QM537_00070 [Candidatus Symbiobacter sp.]|nr:hypothetical protein [Candidatus Symbiobacter sp.]